MAHNPHHKSGTFACYRCVKEDVDELGDLCGTCRQIERARFNRSGKRTTQTDERTHRRYRAPLGMCDDASQSTRVPSPGESADFTYANGAMEPGQSWGEAIGKAPPHASLGTGSTTRESWDHYMRPPSSGRGASSIPSGEDENLERLADAWLKKHG